MTGCEPVRERERVSECECECECECRCVCVVQLGLSERDVVAALKETPQRESSPPGHVSQSGQCFIFGALYPSKSGLPGTGIRSGNTQVYRETYRGTNSKGLVRQVGAALMETPEVFCRAVSVLW